MIKQDGEAIWIKPVIITDNHKLEISKILKTDKKDTRLELICSALAGASQAQQVISHNNKFKSTKAELRQQLLALEKSLKKSKKIINNLNYNNESLLDQHHFIINKDENFINARGKEESGAIYYHLNKMEFAVRSFQEEISVGKSRNHTYSMSIKIIGGQFIRHFPEHASPKGKTSGDETVFSKLISFWLVYFENQKPVSPKAKIEAAFHEK